MHCRRDFLSLLLAILATNVFLAAAAPASSSVTTKPVHIDKRDGAKTKPVHIDRRSMTKPVHVDVLNTKRSTPGTTVLKPVRLDHFEGIQRRDIEEDYSRLDLSQQAFMIYAAQEEGGEGVMMANMTLFAPNGVPVIMMERFEGLTKAVDCSIEKDGFVGLTLKDQKGFDHAREAWDWINDGENDEFILITDHEGCSPGDQRKGYQ